MDEKKAIYDRRYLGGYREHLDGYEVARWKALEHVIQKVVKVRNVGSVLDYGSGSGLYVDLWKKVFPGAELYFCDVSSVALEKLTRKYQEFRVKCAAVEQERAAFGNGLFDAVVSVEVMEHVESLDNYLNDIYRLLKPAGIFTWTTPCANRFSIEHAFSVLTGQCVRTSEGFRRWKWEDPSHLRRLTSGEIREKLQDTGFENIGFRFRAHIFSFVCTYLLRSPLRKVGERMMLLDYLLFRRLPNAASMIGYATKG